jgi:hypoxanthine phosphoribosyltransferase
MEDLQRGHILITPEFISQHLSELEKEFDVFGIKIQNELKNLENESKPIIEKYRFDKNTGRSFIQLSKLSPAEKKLKEEVSKRFSFANFFDDDNGKVKNRNEIYYATFTDDKPRDSQVINICLYLDLILAIFQEIKKEDFVNGSFIIASLLDDIRYKFILLYEDILDNDIDLPNSTIEELTSTSIINYYNYLLGVPQHIISHSQMLLFVKKARKFIIDYLEKFDRNLKPIRKYKEADNPIDNLLLINKLKHNLPEEEIQCIIGIRFGGIELPYLIKHFIYPRADIKLVKVSKYSSDEPEKSEKEIIQYVDNNRAYFKTKNILVVDDSITTARTLGTLIKALKDKCRNIYFSCVYYSQKDRIPHMRMEGHGGVNLQELNKCCVLKETNYTASANMKSYLGRNNKFDLTKEEIKKRLAKIPQKFESTSLKTVTKNENTKKVFIACSQSMVTESYNALRYIRNHFNSKKEFQIIDDWIDGKTKRIFLEDGTHKYKETDGRNFLNEAINDIRNSDLIILYYPAPSTYLSLLFRIAESSDKEILICYSHIADTKVFENYQKKKLIQIQKLKTTLSKI